MTGIAPPPAATNKDTTAIAGGSTSTAPLLPPADIATSANNSPSDLSSGVENNLRTTTPPLPTSDNNLVRFASAFALFSPNTQSQALNLINNPSSSSTLPSKILFSTSHELPALSSSTDFSYGIHPFIITLAKNKVHIPLTLFTSHSTRKLHTETTSLKQNTVYNSSGSKCHILDLSQFPEELKMDSIDWHESWQRYMVFQGTYCDPEVAARWKEHYLFLSAHDDFRLHFPAVLLFDIAERSRYSINPRAFNRENYLHHLESIKLEVMSATIRNATRELGQDLQPSGSKARFQPYSQEFRKFRPASSDPKSSFRERDSKGDIPRSAPLCLCCKRTGHKFSDCTEDTTPAGVPTYSRYLDGKLTLRSNPTVVFCITFQLNSTKRHCKTDHPSQHACSWCGSSDHGACARKCL
jgi:hypothetical protein